MVKDLNDPTNVDTVPAMLTEGEFVLTKKPPPCTDLSSSR